MRYYVPGKSSLYEQDFMRWAEAQAEGLRRAAEAGSNLPLDWYNLAEEIESLGRSQRRELRSRLANIVEHLLKLQFSPQSSRARMDRDDRPRGARHRGPACRQPQPSP